MEEKEIFEYILNNSFSTFVALFCLYKIDKSLIRLSVNVEKTNSILSLLFELLDIKRKKIDV